MNPPATLDSPPLFVKALGSMAASRLPLAGLRVFAEAARAGSFLKAADALFITPGAVSRQIKALELELGVRLFERSNRLVRLTPAGEMLASSVTQGLAILEQAVDRVRPSPEVPLIVSATHSLAGRWLAPRLHLFTESHPGHEIIVSASDAAIGFGEHRLQVAIRHGVGPYPKLHCELLARERLVAVCSPSTFKRLQEGHPAGFAAPDNGASLLAKATLLQDINPGQHEPSWTEWLLAAGIEGIEGSTGPGFSNTYLALEAALSSRGVALASEVLVVDDLARGRLVKILPFAYASGRGFWILCLPEQAGEPIIRRFREWLLKQARADGLPLFS